MFRRSKIIVEDMLKMFSVQIRPELIARNLISIKKVVIAYKIYI